MIKMLKYMLFYRVAERKKSFTLMPAAVTDDLKSLGTGRAET